MEIPRILRLENMKTACTYPAVETALATVATLIRQNNFPFPGLTQITFAALSNPTSGSTLPVPPCTLARQDAPIPHRQGGPPLCRFCPMHNEDQEHLFSCPHLTLGKDFGALTKPSKIDHIDSKSQIRGFLNTISGCDLRTVKNGPNPSMNHLHCSVAFLPRNWHKRL